MLWNSLACHALRPHGADLLCLLDQRATVAAPERQDVHQEAARNVLRITYLSAYRCPADDVGDRDALDEAADETAFADFLRHSTSRVAWHEVRYDADAAVVETPEQTVLEFCHFPLLPVYISSLELINSTELLLLRLAEDLRMMTDVQDAS
jgi:hypothetical protein